MGDAESIEGRASERGGLGGRGRGAGGPVAEERIEGAGQGLGPAEGKGVVDVRLVDAEQRGREIAEEGVAGPNAGVGRELGGDGAGDRAGVEDAGGGGDRQGVAGEQGEFDEGEGGPGEGDGSRIGR